MTAHALRSSAATNAWRSSIFALLVLMAILLGAYHETGAAMFAIWMRSETYAHALVVPPIVLWLVWRRRDELRQITPKP